MVNAGWTMMVVLWGRLTAGYGDEVDPPAGIASLKSGEIWSRKIRTLHLSYCRFYSKHLNIKIFATLCIVCILESVCIHIRATVHHLQRRHIQAEKLGRWSEKGDLLVSMARQEHQHHPL